MSVMTAKYLLNKTSLIWYHYHKYLINIGHELTWGDKHILNGLVLRKGWAPPESGIGLELHSIHIGLPLCSISHPQL